MFRGEEDVPIQIGWEGERRPLADGRFHVIYKDLFIQLSFIPDLDAGMSRPMFVLQQI